MEERNISCTKEVRFGRGKKNVLIAEK
jgi:hypothetical protein